MSLQVALSPTPGTTDLSLPPTGDQGAADSTTNTFQSLLKGSDNRLNPRSLPGFKPEFERFLDKVEIQDTADGIEARISERELTSYENNLWGDFVKWLKTGMQRLAQENGRTFQMMDQATTVEMLATSMHDFARSLQKAALALVAPQIPAELKTQLSEAASVGIENLADTVAELSGKNPNLVPAIAAFATTTALGPISSEFERTEATVSSDSPSTSSGFNPSTKAPLNTLPEVAKAVVQALPQPTPDALSAILSSVAQVAPDSIPEVTKAIVQALPLPTPEALSAILSSVAQVAPDSIPEVTKAIVQALPLPTPDAFSAILSSVAQVAPDSLPEVAKAIVQALPLPTPDAFSAILSSVAQVAPDALPEVAKAIVQALPLPTPDAFSAILSSVAQVAPDALPEVAKAIVQALPQPTPDAFSAILSSVAQVAPDSLPEVAKAIVQALPLPTPEALSAILSSVAQVAPDSLPEVAKAIVQALPQPTPEALSAILSSVAQVAPDALPEVAKAIVQALPQPTPEALSAILSSVAQVAPDALPEVAKAIVQALPQPTPDALSVIIASVDQIAPESTPEVAKAILQSFPDLPSEVLQWIAQAFPVFIPSVTSDTMGISTSKESGFDRQSLDTTPDTQSPGLMSAEIRNSVATSETQGPAPQKDASTNILNLISQTVRTMKIGETQTSITLQSTPELPGETTLQVRLVNGQLQVTITATNPAAAQLLQSNAAALQANLSAFAGVSQVSIVIEGPDASSSLEPGDDQSIQGTNGKNPSDRDSDERVESSGASGGGANT